MLRTVSNFGKMFKGVILKTKNIIIENSSKQYIYIYCDLYDYYHVHTSYLLHTLVHSCTSMDIIFRKWSENW